MKSRVVCQIVQHKQEELAEFLSPFFVQEEARQTALRYTCDLMSKAERKNSWQLAEETGLKTPIKGKRENTLNYNCSTNSTI